MNKKTQYALNGAAIGGIGALILNAIKQLVQMNENPKQKFDWSELLEWGAKGTLLGAGTGLITGAIADELNKHEEPIDTDAWLKDFIQTFKLDIDSPEYQVPNKKSEKIMQFVTKRFGEDLAAAPFIWGSVAKGTALQGNSDFDIMVRFRKDSNLSLEEMYERVFKALNKYPDPRLLLVRRQSKSIGLIFESKLGEYKIDVVPMRDTNDDPQDTAASLYINAPDSFSEPSRTKTDIGTQKRDKPKARQIDLIIALKQWKADNDIPMSSYLLEQFVKRAYQDNKGHIPRSLTDKLMMIVHHIHDNIETITIRGVENTNNVLTDIPASDKRTIRKALSKIIQDYEYQPNSIADHFSMD